MLGALDTGSAFEGMGASREATFAALLEPAFFLAVGAMCLATGGHALGDILVGPWTGGARVIWLGAIVALLIVVQVESARMPIDDPTTHLELTMIHEVMILDHSGRELAAVQLASAMKLTAGLSLVATLLDPFSGGVPSVVAAILNVALCLLLAVGIGTVESLVARLRLRAVPQYVVVALFAAVVALLASTWRGGGPV
jgi:formate hydrogenlyase subunit 4